MRRGGAPLIRSDGTADCGACGLPLFPRAVEGDVVRLECPNRHHTTAPVPSDAPTRRLVDGWIARHRAQMHEQHERWSLEEEHGDDVDL